MTYMENRGKLSITAAAEKKLFCLLLRFSVLCGNSACWKCHLDSPLVTCISVREGPSEWKPAEGNSDVNKYQHVKRSVNGINLGHYFHYLEM